MSKFVLTCCSTADMPYEYFLERKIPYVSFHFNIDGKEYVDDLGQTMSFEEFYRRIDEGAMPITSQVNVGQFIEFFEPFLKESKDSFSIPTISILCFFNSFRRISVIIQYGFEK